MIYINDSDILRIHSECYTNLKSLLVAVTILSGSAYWRFLLHYFELCNILSSGFLLAELSWDPYLGDVTITEKDEDPPQYVPSPPIPAEGADFEFY